MTKSNLQEMFDAGVHIGHRTHKWNPRMKKFIHGEKNGIHIINLEKTAKYFADALDFLAKNAAEGKSIMFVSTKPQAISLLESAANDCNMPYVTAKWIPGLLTNFPTIKARIKYLADLKSQETTGEFSKYTKKEASKLRKTIQKLETSLGGVQSMTEKPDIVFVVDIVRDKIVVKEARKLGIPVVGIADTNADPTEVDYPIPGNDDAIKSLEFFVDNIVDTIKTSHKSKK